MKYIDSFRRFLIQAKKAKSTVRAYVTDITDFFELINKSVEKINSEDIANFKRNLKVEGISNKTITRKLNSLNAFYKWLIRNNIVDENPFVDISYPKSLPKKQRVLKEGEYRRLLANARDKNMKVFTMVSIILYTGIKISELQKLEVGDIDTDFKNPTLKVKRDNRKVPLTDKALFLLSSYLNEFHEYSSMSNFPLFYTSNKKPIAVRNIRKMINDIFSDSDLFDVSVNDLRSTFIVKQLEAGNSIEYVSEIAGNKSTEATERYLSYVESYDNNNNERIVEL